MDIRSHWDVPRKRAPLVSSFLHQSSVQPKTNDRTISIVIKYVEFSIKTLLPAKYKILLRRPVIIYFFAWLTLFLAILEEEIKSPAVKVHVGCHAAGPFSV